MQKILLTKKKNNKEQEEQEFICLHDTYLSYQGFPKGLLFIHDEKIRTM